MMDKYYQLKEEKEVIETRIKIKEEMLIKLDKKYNEVFKEREMLKEKVKILEMEKEEALSRLSKITGQKLTEGNPSITDLSNPNRPAKIGERWATLYTDEWTDAFDVLSSNTTDENCNDGTEQRLSQITDYCYKKCKYLAENQMKNITSSLQEVVNQMNLNGLQSEASKDICRSVCLESSDMGEVMKSFVDIVNLHRQNQRLVKIIVQKCVADFKMSNTNAASKEIKFVEKCSELCWFMAICDPPMTLEYENFEGKTIDTNKFNKYIRNGRTIEFVVWPVLLLHKDGPVLAKGTVQTKLNQT